MLKNNNKLYNNNKNNIKDRCNLILKIIYSIKIINKNMIKVIYNLYNNK